MFIGNAGGTDSLVVLDAHTGKLRDAYQLIARDFHDWDDVVSPP